MHKHAAGILLCVAALSGCVKRSDYDALSARAKESEAALNGQLEASRKDVGSLQQALAEEQARSRAKDEDIAQLKQELESARARQLELQAQLTDLVKDRSKLAASVQEMQDALNALNEQKRQTEARIAEYRKLLSSFKALIDAGKLKVKVVDGRMVVELPSDVLFASGSVDLSEAGKASIAEIGQILASLRDKKFQIEGHTDDQPIKTTRFPNNWALAAGRAIAVAEILVKSGLATTAVSAASFGEFRPVATNVSPEGRSQNRRIEIVLVPDLSKVPGFEELEAAAKG
jgi:chemotaxis protein MotB